MPSSSIVLTDTRLHKNTTTIDEELQSTETIHDASRLLVQLKGNERPSPHPNKESHAAEATTQQRHRRQSRRASRSRVYTRIVSPCSPTTMIAEGKLRHHRTTPEQGTTREEENHTTTNNPLDPRQCEQAGKQRGSPTMPPRREATHEAPPSTNPDGSEVSPGDSQTMRSIAAPSNDAGTALL
ncbi:hypothetical protein VPH35_034912 [Triticum aestivum]|uniref:Uncharacterized protein n=2 Tax=Aegilops tauschii TaxID=37682 RepID=A0A453AN92_AEGTS